MWTGGWATSGGYGIVAEFLIYNAFGHHLFIKPSVVKTGD